MEKPKLAPLPWRYEHDSWGNGDLPETGNITILSADDGVQLSDTSQEGFKDVAAYICHVVNTYDDLLSACEAALALFENEPDDLRSYQAYKQLQAAIGEARGEE